ncbi:hypothetical protein NM688_g5469 [Phlebia brevispora]|uniref:Uncharacterized protein n=1 Tax=Phlebia brevispora TaxID=194682 RepID=A0ACC1SUS2_9APHY|nr:hypothetical protein NM688_g5469 [Phlebia brevispora]
MGSRSNHPRSDSVSSSHNASPSASPSALTPPGLATTASMSKLLSSSPTPTPTPTPAIPSSSVILPVHSAPSSSTDFHPPPQRKPDRLLGSNHMTTADFIADPLLQIRQQLVDDPRAIYLGNEMAITTLVGWVRDGRTDLCVRADDLTSYSVARNVYRKQPDDHLPPVLPEPVLFSVIAQISSNKFFMQADANYTGGGRFSTRFADTKLTALIEPAESLALADDFKMVMSNLDTLVKSKRTRGFQTVKGIFDTVHGQRKFRIKHTLFTPRSEVDEDTESLRPAQFTIARWPINPKHPVAVEEHRELIHTHIVNFLPAFDHNGILIEPTQYESQLSGAIVSLHFTISHWTIAGRSGSDASDTFVLDVKDISVIEPPAATSTGGKKRARPFIESDPFTLHKKRRVDENRNE